VLVRAVRSWQSTSPAGCSNGHRRRCRSSAGTRTHTATRRCPLSRNASLQRRSETYFGERRMAFAVARQLEPRGVRGRGRVAGRERVCARRVQRIGVDIVRGEMLLRGRLRRRRAAGWLAQEMLRAFFRSSRRFRFAFAPVGDAGRERREQKNSAEHYGSPPLLPGSSPSGGQAARCAARRTARPYTVTPGSRRPETTAARSDAGPAPS
jgi:hypothetical protein